MCYTLSRSWSRAALCGVLLVGCLLTPGQAGSADRDPDPDGPKFRGAGACTSCHTLRTGNNSEEFVLLTEYTTWRLSDRHSLAYTALLGPRGQQMARNLGQDVTAETTGCLGCHTVHYPKRVAIPAVLKEGVSCESCHGPAEKWFGPHSDPSWRLLSAAEKLDKGLVDLRNPAERARVCLSCHIGDAAQGKVVTHAMFAAGHPPLPSIEVATFSEHLPRHWRLLPDVPYLKGLAQKVKDGKAEDAKILERYHFATADSTQTQLVLATSLAGLRSSMALVAERALLTAKDSERRWPETAMPAFADNKDVASLWPQLALAHSDCLACHHELQRPSWRQVRGFPGRPGRPQVQSWPATLPLLGAGADAQARTALAEGLRSVAAACDARPFGDPNMLRDSAGKLGGWAQGLLERGDLRKTAADRLPLLHALAALPDSEYPNFDSARQIADAIRVVYFEYVQRTGRKPDNDAAIRQWITDWDKRLDLNPQTGRRARQQLLIGSLEKLSNRKLRSDAPILQLLDALAVQGFAETQKAVDNKELVNALNDMLEALMFKGGSELTEALIKDPAFLQEVDRINVGQLQAALNRGRDYDAPSFKEGLKKLAKLLPRK